LGLQREGVNYSQLAEPVRWSQGDQLEETINELLFLTEGEPSNAFSGLDDGVHGLELERLVSHPDRLQAIYQLLHLAHYRTSPNDLRVLLDSPGQSIFVTVQDGALVGVAWISAEGGLSAELSEAIAQGVRRPNGNLLPQTLIFSEGMVTLGPKRFWRIARIAVAPDFRRSGIAAAMLRFIEEKAIASQIDFIGASFAGYQEVWQFWNASGYRAIRMGDRIDPVAGEPALLVKKALNANATDDIQFICEQAVSRYQFEIERGLRSAMPVGFEALPKPLGQRTLSSHQIESLKRFAQGSAPLTLVRPWIELLDKGFAHNEVGHLELKPNKHQLKTLRNRVSQLID
jgi:tRNA(Met) cytidine acetyltransferase